MKEGKDVIMVYGLTISDLSIVISIITTVIVILWKLGKWLVKFCITHYTNKSFEKINNRLDYVEEHLQTKVDCAKQCNEMEENYVTKEELEHFSENMETLAQNIRQDFAEMTKRIDNFLILFANRKD